MLRREDGFTLIELAVVLIIVGILLALALSFNLQAREKAGDATARSNIRIAVPAVEAYRSDTGSYAGMTLAGLQAAYSPGIRGIVVVSADDAGYCVSASAGGRTWYKAGPDGEITTTVCS